MEGWVKISRKIIDWEWYTDGNTCRLFLHLIITANICDKSWRGINIKRGQRFTSVQNLARELKMTDKQIRNCLSKLKNTSEIDYEGASCGTMITICKYEDYQVNENQKGEQIGKRRANEGRQLKNDKKEEEVLLLSEQIQKLNLWIKNNAPNVFKVDNQITDEQLTELKRLYAGEKIKDYLLRMHNWKDLSKKNTSVYLTLLNWARKDEKKEKENRI